MRKIILSLALIGTLIFSPSALADTNATSDPAAGGTPAPAGAPAPATGTAPAATTPAPAATTPSPAATTPTPVAPSFYSGKFFGADEPERAKRFELENLVNTLLPGVARWIAGFLAAIAVIFLIYAGILFLTAGGEEEKITEATKTAFYVLAGLMLSLFAYAIVYLFLTLFSPG